MGDSQRASLRWWPLLLGLTTCGLTSGTDTPPPVTARAAIVEAQLAAERNPSRTRHRAAVHPLSLPRRPGFEANQGQWPGTVSYVARDGHATLFLTPTEAAWRLPAAPTQSEARSYVRMRWLGANPTPEVIGEVPQTARVNYARGRERAAWRFAVPLYGRVTYRDLYPGIDLVFHDERGALEYDLVVAPGADPSAIRLVFDGASSIVHDDAGEVALHVSGGEIIHRRPIAYQDAASASRMVPASYAVRRSRAEGVDRVEVAFALGHYDPALPLVIDPSVGYVTTVSADARTDNVVDSAVDGEGNLWLAGMTANPQFPVTDDAIDDEKSELDDGYVMKVNAQGQLVYATYFGGSFFNCLSAVDVDADGNAYVAGTTNSNDFPVTQDAAQDVYNDGQGDGFLSKLGPDGQLLYSTYLGGTGSEQCSGRGQRFAQVAVAPDRSVYLVVSISTSTEIPAPGGARATVDGDFFLVRFGPDMSVLWGRFLGSPSSTEQTLRVRTDAEGNAYVLGRTSRIFGSDHQFPVTAGAFQTRSESDTVHFVVKYSIDGDLAYATFLGATTGQDASQFYGDLDVDAAGNAYVVVAAGSDAMPVTPGAYQSVHKGFGDLFIGKLDPSGSNLLYGTYLGGSSSEQPNLQSFPLAINDEGNVYVGGYTFSGDFPQRDALDTADRHNFVAKLTVDGTDLVYSTYVPQGVHTLAVGGGAVYVAGRNLDGIGIGAARIDDEGAPVTCTGDCDGNGEVRVNEVVIGIGIALGLQPVTACAAFDIDDSGTVGISELVGGVGALLNGCA